ncbi:MAG: lysophospholipid acyltransferase family protein [Pseudobdellovibrio sp.]
MLKLKEKWAKMAMKDFGYRIEVKGPPPEESAGPLILVGNHISYLDIMLLMSAYPHIAFIAKKEVRSWPIIGVGADRAGTLFVDRGHKEDRARMRNSIAEQLLQHKAKVAIFPSGTTTLDEKVTWKKGVFEIAAENSIPVKAFKISYDPLRESAYIDEDNLLQQMKLIFKIKNKTAKLTWLDFYQISSPIEDAERIRLDVSRT